MSRHRTTMKMHRVRDKRRESGTAAPTNEAAQDGLAELANGEAAGTAQLPVAKPNGVSRDTLERYLAAEAVEREASEARTSSTLARYFKVSLVMAGLNMVVAGVSVSLLFSHSDKEQTIVVAPPIVKASPPAPSPAAKPEPVRPLAPAAPVTEMATATPAPLTPTATNSTEPDTAPAKPPKIPLLGEPASPARKRSLAKVPTRTHRRAIEPEPAVTSPKGYLPPVTPPPRSFVLANSPASTYEQSQMAERW